MLNIWDVTPCHHLAGAGEDEVSIEGTELFGKGVEGLVHEGKELSSEGAEGRGRSSSTRGRRGWCARGRSSQPRGRRSWCTRGRSPPARCAREKALQHGVEELAHEVSGESYFFHERRRSVTRGEERVQFR